jgi:hypothetical protein
MKVNRHLGNGLDLVNSQRSAYLLDALDPAAMDVAVTKGLGRLSNKFSYLTLLPHWNTWWKGVSSFVVQNRIMDTAEALANGRTVSARDMTRLAQSRLTPEDAIEIYNHFASTSEKVQGSWVIHLDELPKGRAAQKFRDAVNRDVDNTIITPGGADAPIWTGSEFGKTVFQFKRFGASATQRILIAGLQAGMGQRDISVLLGATLMAGMGAASIHLKDLVAGREGKERTTREWVREGIDRSGLLGLYFDLEGMAGAFSSGMTPSALLTGSEPSRYASRNALARIMGPSAGTLQQAVELTSNTSKHLREHGEITTRDLHRAVKMTPFLNLFYLQALTKMGEEGIAKEFGLKEDLN